MLFNFSLTGQRIFAETIIMELKRKIKVTIINLAKVHFNRNFGKHLLLFLNTENPQCFSLEARTKSKSGPNYKELPKFTAKHCLKIALTIPSKKKKQKT